MQCNSKPAYSFLYVMLIAVFIGCIVYLIATEPLINALSSNVSSKNESLASMPSDNTSSASNKTLKPTHRTIKYADDCELPDNWRGRGLTIRPTNYLSFLERRVSHVT